METDENSQYSTESQHRGAPSDATVVTDGGQETSSGGFPIQRGFAYGILAFAVGYLATYLHKSGEAADAAVQGSSPETWKAVGWVFIVMHHATLKVSGGGNSETFGADALSEQWMLLIPVLTLLGAGYLVAARTPDWKDVNGLKVGVAIAAGYLVCIAALAVGSEWNTTVRTFMQSTDVTYKVKMMEAIVIGGIVYPVVLGSIGGLLGDA